MTSKIDNLSEYKVLVTGACGFIGKRLVPALLDKGASVIGIDYGSNFFESVNKNIQQKSFYFISGGFNEKADDLSSQLIKTEKKKSVLIHLAGLAHAGECEKNPAKAFENNVSLTFQTLEFCRKNGISKYIFPSTGLVYGNCLNHAAIEDEPVTAGNVYTATKLAAETLIQGYANSFGLSCMIGRFGNIYGPGSHQDTVIGAVVNQVKKKGEIKVRDLTAVRDFIYIDDAVSGIINLLDYMNEPGSEIFNISTGVGVSVKTVAEIICSIAGIKSDNIPAQRNVNIPASSLVLDNTKISEITGWKPKYSLTEGLKLTLENLW